MKRDLSIILTFLMCICLFGVNIFADDDVLGSKDNPLTTQEQLDAAINAIEENGSGTIYLGTFNPTSTQEESGSETKTKDVGFALSNSGDKKNKTITFIGSGKENTVILRKEGKGYAGWSIHIKDATVKGFKVTDKKNENDPMSYKGFYHINDESYTNCNIEGVLTMYGSGETLFKDCNFTTIDSDNYYVWCYGAHNVTFDKCDFKTDMKAILLYVETLSFDQYVTVKNCTFTATTKDKGAIQINSSANISTSTGKYIVNIENSTQSGFYGIWGVKNDPDGVKASITVDGSLVNFIVASKAKIYGDVQTKQDGGQKEAPKIEAPIKMEEIKQESKATFKNVDENKQFSKDKLAIVQPVIEKLDTDSSDSSKKEEATKVETTAKEEVTKLLNDNKVVINDEKETISSETHEVSSYTLLDIDLVAKDTDGNEATITKLESPIEVSLALDESTLNEVRDAEIIKVLRIHNEDDGTESKELLDATLSEEGVLTFSTDRFSTYVIVTFDKIQDTKPNDSSSNASKPTTTASSCEDAIGKNWSWSESSKSCVYKVSNTSVR